ncbi:hypothetical protein GCM10011492_34090 [Flexivirga endophytica]|uniref:Aminoglycoside phosphotransferase domain-containing protein n=1 Tax=Flexivirga endophytica TaxID=1849103 RepID=A0A916TE13_9MICO|nr:phosphotransferase [Flexivirga endophytica]GGB40460.1 hypothetical protein GCM10011492_34090 [Flexivirga endophytica]GHB48291.1 hypothetical protein GCM10008112_16480 [Flexivirga endophytica]
MRVPPPDVSDADVAQCVASGWGVHVDEIAYVPVGFGSHHWRVRSGAEWLFVTVDVVRDGAQLAAALGTAAALRAQGLEFVHAPRPDTSGGLLQTVAGGHTLVVHEWLDGTVVSSLDDVPHAATTALLARLHAASLATVPARRADLVVQGRVGFEAALQQIDTTWPGPYGERARSLLREHRGGLGDLLAIHDREAAKMLANQGTWVVTHGEPHGDNLISGDDGLHLIDWDTALVAPAARDVWQVGGAPEQDNYRELTGRSVPQDELDHFRRVWDLAEICLYTADFAAPHDETADTAIMWGGFVESLDRLLA